MGMRDGRYETILDLHIRCVCVTVLRMRYEDVIHRISKTDQADILVGFTLQHLQYQRRVGGTGQAVERKRTVQIYWQVKRSTTPLEY